MKNSIKKLVLHSEVCNREKVIRQIRIELHLFHLNIQAIELKKKIHFII